MEMVSPVVRRRCFPPGTRLRPSVCACTLRRCLRSRFRRSPSNWTTLSSYCRRCLRRLSCRCLHSRSGCLSFNHHLYFVDLQVDCLGWLGHFNFGLEQAWLESDGGAWTALRIALGLPACCCVRPGVGRSCALGGLASPWLLPSSSGGGRRRQSESVPMRSAYCNSLLLAVTLAARAGPTVCHPGRTAASVTPLRGWRAPGLCSIAMTGS